MWPITNVTMRVRSQTPSRFIRLVAPLSCPRPVSGIMDLLSALALPFLTWKPLTITRLFCDSLPACRLSIKSIIPASNTLFRLISAHQHVVSLQTGIRPRQEAHGRTWDFYCSRSYFLSHKVFRKRSPPAAHYGQAIISRQDHPEERCPRVNRKIRFDIVDASGQGDDDHGEMLSVMG